MAKPFFVISALALLALTVYLFVDAPAPLPDGATVGRTIPVEVLLTIAESENDVARGLYTKEIVGAGLKAGLAFEEEWRRDDVQAGPLPALFLRETASSLEKNPARLSLFLGSDFPINASNGFEGIQLEKFAKVKASRGPEIFFSEDTQLYTAMFPDLALAEPCVTCHNEHAQSPKTDWQLDDVMGATTWSYPQERVSHEEALEVLAALRGGFRASYEAYLAEAETFDNRPPIGDLWPRDGYFLPSADVFMTELERRASISTVRALMSSVDAADETGRPGNQEGDQG